MIMEQRWLWRVRRTRVDSSSHRIGVHEDSREDADIPIVPCLMPYCAWCGSDRSSCYGTHDLKEGRTRWHLCRACGRKFKSREIELPES